MRCLKPFVSGRAAFGCGQCLPCRVNRRRTWTHRLLLEGACHEQKSFVTLTYSDERLPGNGSLDPECLQRWLKRIRKRSEPARLRYFAVGEYGDDTFRPHYHVALFGFPACTGCFNRTGGHRCASCSVVSETWGNGHVLVGELSEASAQYLCGYVTKKMTAKDDVRLQGRYPEFARMSLRPGIGANALWEVASTLMQYNLEGSLPSQLRHGSSKKPLGRYLRRRLSEMLGQSDEQRASISDQALSHCYEELQLVRAVAWATDKAVREVFREANEPYAQALAGKATLKRRKL